MFIYLSWKSSNVSLSIVSLIFLSSLSIKSGDKIYTSGKEGVFSPGIPIGEAKIENNKIKVLLFSNLNQITFVNIDLSKNDINK